MRKFLRNWLRPLLCAVILQLFGLSAAWAQGAKLPIEGSVADKSGEPLVGVTMLVKGTSIGTTTDAKGYYRLDVPAGSTLSATYIGYIGYEVRIGRAGVYDITLTEDTKSIDEVIVVGYGSVTRKAMSGAVSTLKTDEIMKAPVGNVSGALAGRVPGLMTKQSGGQPGDDNTSLRIRGLGTYGSGGVLVLVDGVERPYTQLDPEEIESFTVLKDAASTAVYGIRGGDGVLLVTTKRGKLGEPKVSFTANFALQSPTRMPQSVNSYDYARLYNEGFLNDNPGGESPYTEEVIQKYRDHSDPLFYPDADWVKLATRKFSQQQKYNVNVSGGTKFARYFVSLGFLNQGGMQKEMNKQYDYSNRDDYRRLNVRSNIDMSVTKSTTVSLTIGVASGHKQRTPGDASVNSLFRYLCTTPPNVTPGIWDGKYIMLESAITKRNPLHSMTLGIKDIYENRLDATLEVKQNLDFITKGLKFKAMGAFDNGYAQTTERTKTEQLFYPKYIEDGDAQRLVFYSETDPGQLSSPSNTFSARMKRYYGNFSLSYEASFGKHNVAALALFSLSKKYYNVGAPAYVPSGYIEYVGRVSYNYDHKYLVEFNLGVNGSEQFPANQRFGWFPAVSAGWVISNEKFFKDAISSKWISYLKLRASYGEVGNDKNGNERFLYLPASYTSVGNDYRNSFALGESPVVQTSVKEDKPGTPNVTWERARKQNYAIDLKMFRDKFFLTVEYFIDKRSGILWGLNTLPDITGMQSGTYNIGRARNHGVEFEAGWSQSVGDWSYFVRGNYSFARNKILYQDEAKDFDNPNLWKTGRRIGEIFGYVQEGFFKSQEEIDAWPSQFGVELKPGDVKYRDVNGDGVVDTKDQVPIGHPNFPEISYGLSGGFSYKNFDLSFLFQGAANFSLTLAGGFQKPFDSLGTIFEHQQKWRWTPENADRAKYPRLSVSHATAQNYYNSTIWVKDASYLRLKNVEIGYEFPKRLISKLRLSSLRVYLSGQNLFTVDRLDGIIDPENKTGEMINYPQQRVFNIGVNLKF